MTSPTKVRRGRLQKARKSGETHTAPTGRTSRPSGPTRGGHSAKKPKGKARALTHLDAQGRARMVDVGKKPETERVARASARVAMHPETLAAIVEGAVPKGDVLATARIAGIQAAKRCHELIPLCHPLRITSVALDFEPEKSGPGEGILQIEATVRALDRTGVEMEALTAASVAALTVYDMCKALDRGMIVQEIRLEEKQGGASGNWVRGG